MDKLFEAFAKVVSFVALAVVMICFGALIGAFPLKWAWNYSITGIFHLKEIGYWEAFCLIWVAGALIKAAPKKAES